MLQAQYSQTAKSEVTEYCPTCRLQPARIEAHQKPCTMGSGGWKLRKMKWRFTIPIILLPVLILLATLYYSHCTLFEVSKDKDNNHHTHLHYGYVDTTLVTQLDVSIPNDLEVDNLNARQIFTDLTTSFVPNDDTDGITPHLSLENEPEDRSKRESPLNIDTTMQAIPYKVSTLTTIPHEGTAEVYQANEEMEADEETEEIVWTIPNVYQEKPQVQLNQRKMEQILDNLVSNNIEVPHKMEELNLHHRFWQGGDTDKTAIRYTQARLMAASMDTSADPCTDFYQYACGNWELQNPIPRDKGGYDTFEMLRESLDLVLKEILETPFHQRNLSSYDAWRKAQNLYKSCMDYDILAQRGEKPLLDLLTELGGWPILNSTHWNESKFNWLRLMAKLRLYNNDILLSEWVGPDIKNSEEYVIQFDQTTLGLPTRDYFLHSLNAKYLDAYKAYMTSIAILLGGTNVTLQVNEIIDFETSLAWITSSTEDRRNVSQLYQRMTVGDLKRYIPQLDWFSYLDLVLNREVRLDEPVVVFALKYIQDMIQLVGKTPPRVVANYLLWRFVRHRISNLDDRFQEAKQKFYRILMGREKSPNRWKTCVMQVNNNMGMALGAMFVQQYFDEHSKNDTLMMTEMIKQSFHASLANTSWIDNQTKAIAYDKTQAMLLRIGYPDFILDADKLNSRYSDVVIEPDLYFENTLVLLRHLTRMEQDRIGHVVNKTHWNTPPAVVNAYYSRNKNQIIFPAGILQPPFYHRLFPKCLNFGGIGVVIGHEITHGFDDKGRLFDQHGNLNRWWQDAAIDGFHQRAQCLIDQYSKYIVSEIQMSVDGVNTQGENIADNGGIKQAYLAYHRYLEDSDDGDESLPGFNATNDQLFFLNFAQIWCGSTRPETARNKLKTTVHAPGRYRVIGTLANSEEFATAYQCAIGTPMNPREKCSVW